MSDSSPYQSQPGASLISNDTWPRIRVALGLSPRELQVIQGVFQDDKEESIANDLGISRHTVNTYLQRLYTKLRVSSRSQLIIRVVDQYLITSSRVLRARD
jgi:DNA-binding CsgD family transcriptional regulator